VDTTSPTSGCRSVGIIRSWTKPTEFSLVYTYCNDGEGYSFIFILLVDAATAVGVDAAAHLLLSEEITSQFIEC
jgi:hypothetical protein